VCVFMCKMPESILWIVFQNQVHRLFFSGPWYKRLKKRKTAKQNLYFENFHFFQNRCCLVQWCKAPLVMLALWFESCEAHPFCKNISESFGSWKSFCLVGGRMDGWSVFFAISCPFTSQSVLVWVQFPAGSLIYFLFQLKWRNMMFLVIISVIGSLLPFPCHECPKRRFYSFKQFILFINQFQIQLIV